ncbi:MAG: hypothetical protein QM401_12270 [Bacillota bacterium]|nr:hypothetical protein [Bacillota bacterium]
MRLTKPLVEIGRAMYGLADVDLTVKAKVNTRDRSVWVANAPM